MGSRRIDKVEVRHTINESITENQSTEVRVQKPGISSLLVKEDVLYPKSQHEETVGGSEYDPNLSDVGYFKSCHTLRLSGVGVV